MNGQYGQWGEGRLQMHPATQLRSVGDDAQMRRMPNFGRIAIDDEDDDFDGWGVVGVTAATLALVGTKVGIALTAAGIFGVAAATRTAKRRCKHYRKKYKRAKMLGKSRRKLRRLKFKRDKWCKKARTKRQRKKARVQRRVMRKGGGMDLDLQPGIDMSLPGSGINESAFPMETGRDIPMGPPPMDMGKILPLLLIGGAGLALVMVLKK